jgi:hypothetical protein
MDKANFYGFSVPKGTMMVTYKVVNDDLWNLIKEKVLRGFSIEGNFLQTYVEKMSKIDSAQNIEEVVLSILKQDKSDDELFDELTNLFTKVDD